MTQANNVAIESSQINSSGVLQPAGGGTGTTTSTGSGDNVLSNSPTFVTPVLGTPASGTLTNCTFPTLNQNTTGTAGGLTGTPNITVGTIGATSGTFSSTISASNFSGSSSGTNTGDQTNISGNAATATTATTANKLNTTSYSAYTDWTTNPLSMQYYNIAGAPDGGSYSVGFQTLYSSDTNYGWQIVSSSGTDALYYRRRQGGAFESWKTILSSANYNSYSPTLTGTGASGTWGISVTGNAATVTNGVYTTSSQIIKAWVNWSSPTSPAIQASYNVSSVTYNGTGFFAVNFTSAFADAKYAVSGVPTTSNTANGCIECGWAGGTGNNNKSTTSVGIYAQSFGGGAAYNPFEISVIIIR
jgi:hypothetical protein